MDGGPVGARQRRRGRLDPSPWTDSGEDTPDGVSPTELPVGVEWPTRALNFLLALLAIVSLLPVFLLLAVLIKLTSRGPVFYLQERVGLDRRAARRRSRQPPPDP